MSRTVAFACTLAVGGLVALQPPANAALARHVGALGAALISAAITAIIPAVFLDVFSEPARLSGLAGFKPHYAIGGIGGAAVVAVSLVAVRPSRVAGVVSLLVAGQLVISVHRLGSFGVAHVGLTPGRLAGVVACRGGTMLITRP